MMGSMPVTSNPLTRLVKNIARRMMRRSGESPDQRNSKNWFSRLTDGGWQDVSEVNE